MSPEYRIINQCLHLLRQCEMPPIMKLRVEIQLIHMKRILLSNALATEPCRESALNQVLRDIREMCNGGSGATAVGALMNYIGNIISGLPTIEAIQRPPHAAP